MQPGHAHLWEAPWQGEPEPNRRGGPEVGLLPLTADHHCLCNVVSLTSAAKMALRKAIAARKAAAAPEAVSVPRVVAEPAVSIVPPTTDAVPLTAAAPVPAAAVAATAQPADSEAPVATVAHAVDRPSRKKKEGMDLQQGFLNRGAGSLYPEGSNEATPACWRSVSSKPAEPVLKLLTLPEMYEVSSWMTLSRPNACLCSAERVHLLL